MRPTQNKKYSSNKENITFWIGVVSFLSILLGTAYTVGRWTADREHKEEIMPMIIKW